MKNTAEQRLGFVGIVLERRTETAGAVNEILSEHGELILARTGIPRASQNDGIITLVVQASTDELGRMTGRLGALPGVTVKTALTKKQRER